MKHKTYRVELMHQVTQRRLEDPVDRVTDQALDSLQQVFKADEGALGLHMRVPAGVIKRID